jgi:serine/threonine-protein kinase
MEFLEGESLGDRLRRTAPLSPMSAVSIARHIAGTLAAAHAHGIVHRDLKPDNVFLIPDPLLPRGERAKVLDFGIAKLAGDTDTGMVKTDTGRVMGTPMYMSPEQCRGSGRVDHRSDIYALGCVVYHMLVGRPPFIAEGSGEVIAAHIHFEPHPPSVYRPDLPPEVEAVVMKLLAKKPELRYQSMDDVIVALNDLSEGLVGFEDRMEPSLETSKRFAPLGRRKSARDIALAPTTLGSSNGESVNLPGTRRNRWIPGVIAAAAAVAGGVVVARAVTGEGATPAALAPVVAPDPPRAAVTDVAPLPAPIAEPDPSLEAPVSAPGPATVTLHIESVPPGATVYRESDGVHIGDTPFDYRVFRGEGQAVFIIKRSRYRPQRFAMPVAEANAARIVLARRSGDDPPETEALEAPSAPASPPAHESANEPAKEPPPPRSPGKDEAIDPFGNESPAPAPEPEGTP